MIWLFLRYAFLTKRSELECNGRRKIRCGSIGSFFCYSSFILSCSRISSTLVGDSFSLIMLSSLTLTRSCLNFSYLMNADMRDYSLLSISVSPNIDSKFSWRYFFSSLIACSYHIFILFGSMNFYTFDLSTLRLRLIFIEVGVFREMGFFDEKSGFVAIRVSKLGTRFTFFLGFYSQIISGNDS